jgi:uncharacterized damage-inducible protein DinB
MKQKYAVVVLFALIIASSMVSLTSYKTTENLVTEDVNQALAKALDEQQSESGQFSASTSQYVTSPALARRTTPTSSAAPTTGTTSP